MQQGLAGYIIRRLLFLPLTLLIVSFATFYITRWGPGDPVRVYAGAGYSDPEALDRVREKYGLDKPIIEQYTIWLKNVVTEGDFGPSFRYRDRTIPELLRPKLWVSIQISFFAFILTFAVGIPAGVYAALRQGSWSDPLTISSFLLFQSVPTLVTVPLLLLVFSLWLGWVPYGGFDGMLSASIIVPTLALSLPGIAGVARLARATTLGTLHEDFVRTARAKGLQERNIIGRHVARNSLVPVMTTVIGLSLVGLIEGAFFVETILGIPGIGRFTYESVNGQDYNVILAIVLMITTAFVMANLLVDLLLIIIDPRVRAGGFRR